MKKLFTIAVLVIAAMTVNAQTAVTCAEAAAAMPAQSGDETTDVYIVTGYITNTNGSISPSRTDPTVDQQTFYMDDNKGTKKTIQGYWCNLPGHEALNVGDKITLTGKILNYNGTPEIKNGDVAILERATIVIDTLDVTACEAIEEGLALNYLDYTSDVFIVSGRLSGPDNVNSNGRHTFDLACADNTAIFEAYNCTCADSVVLGVGDSVRVIGKLYNYNGKIEINNGKFELIEKSTVEVVAIEATVAEALAVVATLPQGGKTNDIYAVTGYVDSIATAYSEQYGNISFFMTDNLEAPSYDFEAYRVKATSEQAAKIVVGAKVTVTAQLQRYYKAATDELPEVDLAETVAGGELEIIEDEYDPELADPTNCAEAAAAALSVEGNNVIYNDSAVYTIQGYVTSIATAYSAQYNNVSFWMADSKDGGKVLQAYRAACASADEAPNVGDKVAVTGVLTKYNTTPEFASGCTFEIIERAPAVEPQNLGVKTIAQFLQLKNTVDTCILTGVIAGVVDTVYGNFNLYDETDTVFVYGLLNAAGEAKKCFVEEGLAEGDTLTVLAIYNEYNSKPQAKNAIFVSVAKKAEPEPELGDVTVFYHNQDNSIIDMEQVSLTLPEAPVIEGFTFLKWEVVAGDLKDGIHIQAVYTAESAAPAVYVNPANPAQKLIREGNVYILRDGKTYTVTGAKVK